MAKVDVSCFLLAIFTFFSCKKEVDEPVISLSEFQIEQGFEITCIASEPLIDTPVAIDFDEDGKIWVVEMRGYMPNADGEGEDGKVGRISVLDDTDMDGVMDTKHVFLDSLVMPRALALVSNGLLYCEPPNLYYVEIEGEKPGNKILVDSSYAPGFNPEYQANGLLKTKDGWIYSAGSDKKYRQKKDGSWEIGITKMRGQWGITQDGHGRLFYNNNSVLLMGDYFPSDFPAFDVTTNQVISSDQRIWPNHPTLVNRGYKKGELDSLGRVVNATSACGPLIYLGNQYPEAFQGNAFVCAPEGNLLKRLLLLEDNTGRVEARHAVLGNEFLRSNDPTFRPINLKTGPDGNIYLVDMRRGLIQHQAYLSQYLKKACIDSGLDKVTGKGRIYKITYKGDNGTKEALSKLASTQMENEIIAFEQWDSTKVDKLRIKTRFKEFVRRPDLTTYEKRQVLSILGKLSFLSNEERFSNATTLLRQLNFDTISIDILLYSFLFERKILNEYVEIEKSTSIIPERASHLLRSVENANPPPQLFKNTDARTAGLKIYRTYCAGCHGLDGTGKPKIAPPLVGSSVVNGTSEKLSSVIWNGKSSPVMVNGKLEEFLEPMPGFKENHLWNKEMLEAVVAYVKNAFAEPD